ncbi:MAG: T9SS type A sorting domain-containing protein [Bacteroidetes bacterium]|nr:T9SS type A sorting domain-containing protein [Bacteroidota bacterium]
MKNVYLLLCFIISLSSYAQLPSYVPTNGLVAYYPFDGNANDVSGSNNNGSVNGATLTLDHLGNANSAYHFDGNGQYIEVPHSTSLDFSTNQISLSFWVKVESFPTGGFSDILISKQSGSGTSQSGLNVAQSGQNVLGLLVSSGSGNFGGANVPSNTSNYNVFHHVVLVFESGTGTAYLDGSLIISSTGTATIGANTVPMLFGKANWVNVNADPFNGVLDDVGIWNRALTQQEVSNLFNESLSTPCASASLPLNLTQGLVGWWPFCGNANDESGNGNDGIVNGAALTTDRFNEPASAYSFDGVSNFIEVLDDPTLQFGNSQQSISFWINLPSRPNPIGSDMAVFSKTNQNLASDPSGNSNEGFEVIFNENWNGILSERFKNGNASPWAFTTIDTPQINLNIWKHIVFVVDKQNDSLFAYSDGIKVSQSYIDPNSEIGTNSLSLLFGKGYWVSNGVPSFYFFGKLDDIGMWNRALSPQEVSQLYNAGLCFQTITVTDTLIINANLTGFNPVTYQNSIKVYPNPSNDHVTIDCGSNFGTMNGYAIRIDNMLGQTVYSTPISQQSFYIDLNTWTGNGVYLIYLLNAQGIAIDVRKIVIQ